MLDEHFYPHLAGFTFAKNFPFPLTKSSEIELSEHVGTPLYMAPELLNYKNYGIGVDIYAFSILAFEVVSGFTLKQRAFGYWYDIAKGIRPEFADDVTDPMQGLISRCWNDDTDERPSFDEIYEQLSTDYRSYCKYDLDDDEIENYIKMINKLECNQ